MRPVHERLSGTVEVDETIIRRVDKELQRSRARGKKGLTGIAIKILPGPRGHRTVPDASVASLRDSLTDHVELGTHVITDGRCGYRDIEDPGCTHLPRNQ